MAASHFAGAAAGEIGESPRPHAGRIVLIRSSEHTSLMGARAASRLSRYPAPSAAARREVLVRLQKDMRLPLLDSSGIEYRPRAAPQSIFHGPERVGLAPPGPGGSLLPCRPTCTCPPGGLPRGRTHSPRADDATGITLVVLKPSRAMMQSVSEDLAGNAGRQVQGP